MRARIRRQDEGRSLIITLQGLNSASSQSNAASAVLGQDEIARIEVIVRERAWTSGRRAPSANPHCKRTPAAPIHARAGCA
jgi:hypothetical protein